MPTTGDIANIGILLWRTGSAKSFFTFATICCTWHCEKISVAHHICFAYRAREKSAGVDVFPFSNFEKEAQDMEKRVENELNNLVERIAAYRKAITMHISSLGIHHVLIQRLRDELHFDIQLLSFLQDLQSVLVETHLRMSKLSERFQEQLKILCATIGLQMCIPNELV